MVESARRAQAAWLERIDRETKEHALSLRFHEDRRSDGVELADPGTPPSRTRHISATGLRVYGGFSLRRYDTARRDSGSRSGSAPPRRGGQESGMSSTTAQP